MKLDFYLFSRSILSYVPPALQSSTFSGGLLRPTRLGVSSDVAVENLLADIPFFSVGLLAFGVFTFLLFMKRVTLLSVYLYASALLGFIASVVDLIPILALSRDKTNQIAQFESFTGVFVIRGTAFALSTGFRFLFFWAFVAQCPKGEKPSKVNRKQDLFNLREQGHSASWGRWGTPGLILKWVLLLATFAIPIMQILWRNIPTLLFSPVFFTEATIEVVVSALFSLKLTLNIFLFPNSWKNLVPSYIAPFLALAINLGLGVGNVIFPLSSETTVARFLQATELYILIVYILTFTFSDPPQALPTTTQVDRGSSFRGLREKLPQPNYMFQSNIPGTVMLVGSDPYQTPRKNNDGRLSHLSIASRRLPSLFNLTPKTPRRRSGEERLWNQNSAEQGDLPAMKSQTIDLDEVSELGPRVVELKNSSSSQYPALDVKAQSLASRTTVAMPPVRMKAADSTKSITTRASSDSRPSVSLYSYYDMNDSMDEAPPLPKAVQSPTVESPVYGLNGIVGAASNRSVKAPRPTRKSTSSIDDILRKQKELDRSIAALRLISPPTLTASNTNTAGPSSFGFGRDPRSDSVSAFSEFSLSIFPDPPDVSEGSSRPESLSLPRTRRPKTLREGKPSLAAVPPPITIPPVDNDDINGRLPETVGATSRFNKFDSVGTQYDVTSFIGNLTGPTTGTLTGVTNMFRTSRLSDIQSVDERAPAAVTTVARAKRPVVITATPPRLSSLRSGSTRSTPYTAATASSGVLTSSMFAVDDGRPQQRSATTVAQMPSIFGDLGSRRRRALLTGARMTVSGPRPPPPQDAVDGGRV